jgi:hypothetical protein
MAALDIVLLWIALVKLLFCLWAEKKGALVVG